MQKFHLLLVVGGVERNTAFFNLRQQVLNLFVGADYRKAIAREDAHFAGGHRIIVRASRDAHHIHAITLAYVGIFQFLTYKRTIISHSHECHVKVGNQVVFATTAMQFTLVEVAKKLRLDVVHALAQAARERNQRQQHNAHTAPQHRGFGEDGVKIHQDEHTCKHYAEQRHHHQRHIASTTRNLLQLLILTAACARHRQCKQKRRHSTKRNHHRGYQTVFSSKPISEHRLHITV